MTDSQYLANSTGNKSSASPATKTCLPSYLFKFHQKCPGSKQVRLLASRISNAQILFFFYKVFIYLCLNPFFQSYIHRSGRTARARKEGVSVVLIDASENMFYKRMCKNCNRDDDLPAFPVDSNVRYF